MEWSVADAKRRFSELLRQAARTPQIVRNRGRAVAAVVEIETFRQYEAWQQGVQSLADTTADLRRLTAEGYELEIPRRVDRTSWEPAGS